MILGTGSDLLDMRRIEKVLVRFEKRFIARCFTQAEIETAERRRAGGAHIAAYAKRYAAKEAVSKALGTGIGAQAYLTDISIVNDGSGKPSVILTGQAQQRLQALTPEGQQAHVHIALSDEPPFVSAHVIIESV